MKLFFLFILCFGLVSCASKSSSHSKINALEVNEKLVKDKTTQSQVIETFGTPDVVEKTPDGDMWAYNRHASEGSSMGAGVSHYIASAGLWNWTGASVDGSQSSSATKTASLVLYFNSKKILKDYTFRTERF